MPVMFSTRNGLECLGDDKLKRFFYLLNDFPPKIIYCSHMLILKHIVFKLSLTLWIVE